MTPPDEPVRDSALALLLALASGMWLNPACGDSENPSRLVGRSTAFALDLGERFDMPVLVSGFDVFVVLRLAASASARSSARLFRNRCCGNGFDASISSAFSISVMKSSMEKSAFWGR